MMRIDSLGSFSQAPKLVLEMQKAPEQVVQQWERDHSRKNVKPEWAVMLAFSLAVSGQRALPESPRGLGPGSLHQGRERDQNINIVPFLSALVASHVSRKQAVIPEVHPPTSLKARAGSPNLQNNILSS